MNIPLTIEQAAAGLVLNHSALNPMPRVRCFQNPRFDPSWTPGKDRDLPIVDIRCSPFVPDDNGKTGAAMLRIAGATDADDDQDRTDLARIFVAVQDVFDRLFSQWSGRVAAGAELTAWAAAMTSPISSYGLSFGAPLDPEEDQGTASIGITLNVHIGRSDY